MTSHDRLLDASKARQCTPAGMLSRGLAALGPPPGVIPAFFGVLYPRTLNVRLRQSNDSGSTTARVPPGFTSASFAERLLHDLSMVVMPGSGYSAAGEWLRAIHGVHHQIGLAVTQSTTAASRGSSQRLTDLYQCLRSSCGRQLAPAKNALRSHGSIARTEFRLALNQKS